MWPPQSFLGLHHQLSFLFFFYLFFFFLGSFKNFKNGFTHQGNDAVNELRMIRTKYQIYLIVNF